VNSLNFKTEHCQSHSISLFNPSINQSRFPSPRRGEGQGEGYKIERCVHPHLNPLPKGEEILNPKAIQQRAWMLGVKKFLLTTKPKLLFWSKATPFQVFTFQV